MRFIVVGAGALGGWIAWHLAGDGVETVVVERGERLADLRANGLRLVTAEGVVRREVDARAAAEIAGFGDAVLLCVQDADLEQAARDARRLGHVETAFLPFVEGAGVLDRFAAVTGRRDVCAARAEIRCGLDPSGAVVVESGAGRIVVGERKGSESWRLEVVEATLFAAGIACVIDPELASRQG